MEKKLFWATAELLSCFDWEFADDRVAAAGKNERKHTVTVARKSSESRVSLDGSSSESVLHTATPDDFYHVRCYDEIC